MMKFPSASGGGTAPSGKSLAVTYPGVFGSRVGGAGRVVGAVGCAGGVAADGAPPTFWAIAWLTPVIKPIKRAKLHRDVFMVTLRISALWYANYLAQWWSRFGTALTP